MGNEGREPKSKGAGIMVFDFVDEHNGFPALSDNEYEAAKVSTHASSWNMESKEGYWTDSLFIAQMHRAI